MKNLLRHFTTFLLFFIACSSAAVAADKDAFLEADQAFRLVLQQAPGTTPVLQVDIAHGYHLYRDRFSVHDSGNRQLVTSLPPGRTIFDQAISQQVAIWEGHVEMPLPRPAQQVDWLLDMQGCADEGLCYPPQHFKVQWRGADGQLAATIVPYEPDAAAVDEKTSPSDRIAATLTSGSIVAVVGAFLAFGLLLSFTPCVLPMLPILSSIIVGQGHAVSRGRGFTLALAYSLGMALVYTAMGMLAGWLGQGLAGALQQPWILTAFALLLVALALSMFGLYELQMPAFLQQKLAAGSNRMQGGTHLGVFAMGALSALLVGPCVAPPLAGVLVYISRAHDLFIGGIALFAMAMGMSIPLLALGLSAGKLLPRAGVWMERVKSVFGVMLLATALWTVAPVLPTPAIMAIIGCSMLFGASMLSWPTNRQPGAVSRAAGVPLAVWGSILLVGALSGGQDLVHPLAQWTTGHGPVASARQDDLAFVSVRSENELQQAVSKSAGRPVMLDYYADWCVACKEMEHLTFSDASIHAKLGGALLLRVDVTEDNSSSRALLKKYGLFGPPGIIFLDSSGRERSAASRVIGYLPPQEFAEHLRRIGL